MIIKIFSSLATLLVWNIMGMEKMAKKVSKARLKKEALFFGSIAAAVVVGVIGAGWVFKNYTDPWGIISKARDGFQGVV